MENKLQKAMGEGLQKSYTKSCLNIYYDLIYDCQNSHSHVVWTQITYIPTKYIFFML